LLKNKKEKREVVELLHPEEREWERKRVNGRESQVNYFKLKFNLNHLLNLIVDI